MSIVTPQFSVPQPGMGPGARAVPAVAKLSPADLVGCIVNCQLMPSGQQLDRIAALFIDNTAGPVPLTVAFNDTEMTIDVPAWSQGWFQPVTGAKQFVVSAPLLALVPAAWSVPLQVCNFVPPALPLIGPVPPDANAGTAISLGTTGGWSSFAFTVPGSGLIYSALELDASQYGAPVTVQGPDITGVAWTVTQQAFTRSELAIPPTAAGAAATAFTARPNGVNPDTTALIPARFRVLPSGEAVSRSLPASMASYAFAWTSLAAGNNDQTLTIPAGFGAFSASVSIYTVSLGETVTAQLIDTSSGSDVTFWEAPLPAATLQFQDIVGHTSSDRGGTIIGRIIAGAADAGPMNLNLNLKWAPVYASMNG